MCLIWLFMAEIIGFIRRLSSAPHWVVYYVIINIDLGIGGISYWEALRPHDCC